MPRPEDRDRLLMDWLYGLLDPAEAAEVAAKVAADPEWAAAHQQAAKAHGLIAAAAKTAFPAVKFRPPAEPVAAPARKKAVRVSAASVWTKWAVAASLLLAFAGFGVPPLWDAIGYKMHRGPVEREYAALTTAKQAKEQAEAARDAEKARVAERLAKAKTERNELEAKWLAAEVSAVNLATSQPFSVAVTGPATAVPGAVNDYTIAVTDKQNKPYPATVDVTVRDEKGREIHKDSFHPEKNPDGNKFRLPPGVWSKVPAGSELFLAVSAVDAKTGARSDLTESLRMLEPTYTTFLTTDKPMYRPGETVYFRSLTLDRFRFLPPTYDLPLRFVVLKPDGNALPGSESAGLAKPTHKAADGLIDPILGPDGQPVRGVGTGAVAISPEMPGGEYTLQVFDLPRPGDAPAAPRTKPLAVRKFIVNKYTPPVFQKKLEWAGKSFGPGDTVGFTFEVTDQAAPMADAPLKVSVEADGNDLKPARLPAKTDKDGKAFVEFKLPSGVDEIKRASVSVVVSKMNGNQLVAAETLVKQVPLVTRTLTVEFFPEGGDLIAGVPNRVYFRATTSAGKAADIVGWLTDGHRDICRVNTLTDADNPGVNQGMGAFDFTPTAGMRYAVRLDTPTGIVQPKTVLGDTVASAAGLLAVQPRTGYPLPAAKSDGIAMTIPTGVTKPGEPITVRLHPAGKAAKMVLVGAYTRGQAIAHKTATLTPGQVTEVTLDPGATKLGGVTRVTVFDLPNEEAVGRDDLKPLVERLVFRQPGETLKLGYTLKRAGGKVVKDGEYLTPGAAVELDVTSKDESGAGKPAVLWTAVVNKSVIVDADEKTRHGLPTHFLLTGEVQKGDELEHSDFLLTAHPKAAAGLDLLLGTQGWRRFAEQPNKEFRQKVPAEAVEQLHLASATPGPIPTGWQPKFRKVFDEYWPKYEASLIELESAEQANWEYRNSGDPDAAARAADAKYKAQLAKFGEVVVDLEPFDNSLARRSSFLPFLLGFLALGAVGLLAVRSFVLKPTEAARTPLMWGSVGLLLIAALIGGTSLVSGDDAGWREMAKIAPKPSPEDRYYRGGKVAMAARAEMAPMAPMADAAGMAPRAKRLKEEAERFNQADPEAGFGGEGFPRPGMGGGGRFPGGFPGPVPPPAPPAGPGGPPGFAPPPAMPAIAPPQKVDDQAKNAGKPGMPRDRFDGKGAAGDMPFPGEPMMPGQPAVGGGPRGPGMPGAAMPGRPGRGFPVMKGEQQAAQGVFNEARMEFREKRKAILEEAIGKGDKKALQKFQEMNVDPAALVDAMIPRLSAMPVREYAHARPKTESDDRSDYTETLLWQPVLVTPADGKATVKFALSDQINPYEVLIAGHTLDGRLGSVTGTIEVRKAFSVSAKLPYEIGSSDKIDLPVVGVNEADAVRNGDVTIVADGFTINGPDKVSIPLGAGTGGRKLVRVTPSKTTGTLGLKLNGVADKDTDSFTHRPVTVVADGYPISRSKSEVLEGKVPVTVTVPEMLVPGSLTARVTVYPNTLSEIQAGLDGLLREPYGCFEQTSTTNYPNVLVLDYLTETNQVKPEIKTRAKQLLDNGYGKLTSFECQAPRDPSKRGYEWFGGSAPPHEALTAYGLLQFTDMSRVHPVDVEMMKRTKKYLLGQRDGEGGFKRNTRALDTFGRAPDHVTNAYIVWALTESERKDAEKTDLSKELNALVKKADDSTDPYFLALTANSLWNVDRKADARKLLDKVAKMQDEKNGSVPGAETSVTCSTGSALLIETTGLAVLGWLKANETGTYRKNVDAAASWIGKQRGGYGGFGSTQSTILALKALIGYAMANKKPAENGTVKVTIKGKEVASKSFTTEQTGPIVFDIPDADTLLTAGETVLTIETAAKQSYPVTVNWEARTRKPDSDPTCPVLLTTKLSANATNEADRVRLDVTMTNLEKKGQGMAVAIIGLPAGTKLPEDMKQMKALTDRGDGDKEATVSYWELKGRELILYWRGMSPNQKVEFSLDLIAETPGEFRGPASRAYLYYGAEKKQWVAPLDLTITAK